MAKIKKMPSLKIISGFKGTLDYYYWMGIACVRSWPKSPGHIRSPSVMAQWSRWSYITKQWNNISKEVQDAYRFTSAGTNLTGRDMFVKNYISPMYLELTGSSPPPTPPDPDYWFATLINYIPYPYSPSITLTTDVPCHLTCYWTPIPPRKHPLTRISRGLSVPWYTRFCFVSWQEVTQNEPGDTLCHTFNTPNWLSWQTRWFTFSGSINGISSPSVGPIFKRTRLPSGLYQYYNTGDDHYYGVWGIHWYGQTFTPLAPHLFKSVKLLLARGGFPGDVTVSIKPTDIQGKPTGPDLCSGITDGDTLTTDLNVGDWREIFFDKPFYGSAGLKYAYCVRCPGGDGSTKYIVWRLDTSSPTYTRGQACVSSDGSGEIWLLWDNDYMFEDWGPLP